MKKELLSANPYIPVDHNTGISFKLFIDFITNKIETEKGNRKFFYKYILDKFHQYPELYDTINIDDAKKYEDVLQLVAYCVISVLEDENETLWAFGKTFSPQFFYGSDAFYKLLHQIKTSNQEQTLIDREEATRIHKELQYSFVLEKIFNIRSLIANEWIHRMTNPETGLYQYYRMKIDRRFAWLEVKGELPDFDNCVIENYSSRDEMLGMLQDQLPVDMFEGKGFTIMSFTDVTAQQAIEQMSKVSVAEDEIKATINVQHVNRLLQTIIGSNTFQFGIMPFLAVNNRPAVMYDKYIFSVIAEICWKAGVPKSTFETFVKELQRNPSMAIYREGRTNDFFPEEIQHALQQAGVKFYMLLPAHYNNQPVGILEISSNAENAQLEEAQMAALQPATYIIGRFLHQIINKFNLRIDNIVRDKFTNIQPSVQWKFNEAAWHFLRSNFLENKKEMIEPVSFVDVYPLYGAIDIRNSTNERNAALRRDIHTQMHLLKDTLADVHDPEHAQQIGNIMSACNKWLQECSGFLSVNDETELNTFLETEVHPLLQKLIQTSSAAKGKIENYFSSINEDSGIAFENRRQIESSMQRINDTINHYYDEAKENLQNIYPCYFDKFRTDGVEYDIYTGQSIAPKIAFSREHLQQFRLWQVESMAAIAKLTNGLLTEIPRKLETTQLLFVHSKPIDISFRNDERRFDVEGTYNIRYQVIKKRIDKALVRGTTERITQPGKIAIVYSSGGDANEYLGYIQQLQEKNILLNDLEYLELEELQGVSGLHALRVGVRIG